MSGQSGSGFSGGSSAGGGGTGQGGSSGGGASSAVGGVGVGLAADLVAPIVIDKLMDAREAIQRQGETSTVAGNRGAALFAVGMAGVGLLLLIPGDTSEGLFGFMVIAVAIVIGLVAINRENGRKRFGGRPPAAKGPAHGNLGDRGGESPQ